MQIRSSPLLTHRWNSTSTYRLLRMIRGDEKVGTRIIVQKCKFRASIAILACKQGQVHQRMSVNSTAPCCSMALCWCLSIACTEDALPNSDFCVTFICCCFSFSAASSPTLYSINHTLIPSRFLDIGLFIQLIILPTHMQIMGRRERRQLELGKDGDFCILDPEFSFHFQDESTIVSVGSTVGFSPSKSSVFLLKCVHGVWIRAITPCFNGNAI